MSFSRESLRIDAEAEIGRLETLIRKQVRQDLKRQGIVVGISGGIDSSVVASLCVRAVGPERVLGVMMPEKDSSDDSENLAEQLAKHLGIETLTENIAPVLEGFECYRRRDEAVSRVFPAFGPGYLMKITNAANLLEKDSLNFFKVTIEAPDGTTETKRLPLKEYLQIVAASNFKQRTRMTTLYYHGERLNWAVAGTGNKNEHELGFFVKYGDGGADFKPIAHLFKLQVFQLAEALDIPEGIRSRIPTTDTYSAEQTQTEFFYGVDFDILDPVWYGMEQNVPPTEIATALDLTEEQVTRVMRDIEQKRRTTEYLRAQPLEA